MHTEEVSFRVDPHLKHLASDLFHGLGLTTSAALRLFLEQAVASRGLPFEVKQSDSERERVWAADAKKMHERGEDRLAMVRKPRIADGTEWSW